MIWDHHWCHMLKELAVKIIESYWIICFWLLWDEGFVHVYAVISVW